MPLELFLSRRRTLSASSLSRKARPSNSRDWMFSWRQRAAAFPISTSQAFWAPRLRASKARLPLPAKRSSTVRPSQLGSLELSMEKSDSRTLPIAGRYPSPSTVLSLRERREPAMICMATFWRAVWSWRNPFLP